jgi:hypothetical protein
MAIDILTTLPSQTMLSWRARTHYDLELRQEGLAAQIREPPKGVFANENQADTAKKAPSDETDS